jgi:hypothetical protein
MRKPGQSAGGQGSEPSVSTRRPATWPALPDSFTLSLGKAAAIAAGCVLLIAIAYGIGVQRGRSVARGTGGTESAPAPDAPAASPSPAIPPLGGPSSGAATGAGNSGAKARCGRTNGNR